MTGGAISETKFEGRLGNEVGQRVGQTPPVLNALFPSRALGVQLAPERYFFR